MGAPEVAGVGALHQARGRTDQQGGAHVGVLLGLGGERLSHHVDLELVSDRVLIAPMLSCQPPRLPGGLGALDIISKGGVLEFRGLEIMLDRQPVGGVG